jgi:hypothetical protein
MLEDKVSPLKTQINHTEEQYRALFSIQNNMQQHICYFLLAQPSRWRLGGSMPTSLRMRGPVFHSDRFDGSCSRNIPAFTVGCRGAVIVGIT